MLFNLPANTGQKYECATFFRFILLSHQFLKFSLSENSLPSPSQAPPYRSVLTIAEVIQFISGNTLLYVFQLDDMS